MVKLASIDLGSNSTRLLIAEVDDQGFNVLIRKHVVTKMSENIEQTGVISTEAFKRVNSTLRDFKKLLIANDVDDVFVVGTAALRDAKNSDEIIQNIRKKYDFEVEVLSGHEEGITTSIGVLHFMQNTENFLIIDIGGRSTEFIYEFENKIISKSLNLGVVTLSEKYFSNLPIGQELIDEAKLKIETELSQLDIKDKKNVIGVSGTALSLASIFIDQQNFNEEELHEIKIDIDNIQAINKRILKMTEAEIITKFRGIDPKRASTITSGIFLLEIILSNYSNSAIIISKNDILEGLILKKY
jgi:exopolyphosphatase/guanosine-5'-triphosphate,3'-diphosphate pyrophosphatase